MVEGTFIINTPGTYALAESVTITNPINIQSYSVVFNLNNHTIVGNIATPLIVSTGHKQLQIINGTINALGSGGITLTNCAQLLLDRLNVTTNQQTAINITGSNTVIIDSCTVQGSSPIALAGITIDGFNYLIQNCFASNFFLTVVSGNIAGLAVTQLIIANVKFSNCDAGFGIVNSGSVVGLSHAQVENCTATNCTTGYCIQNACQLVNCEAQNCFDGFFFYSTLNDFQNCKSINNNHYGFTNFLSSVFNLGLQTRFLECIATGNQNDGFFINSPAIGNVIKSSTSYANGGAGYRILDPQSSLTNNVAYSNSGGNFVGSGASVLVATNLTGAGSSIQAIDATYWWNVTPT